MAVAIRDVGSNAGRAGVGPGAGCRSQRAPSCASLSPSAACGAQSHRAKATAAGHRLPFEIEPGPRRCPPARPADRGCEWPAGLPASQSAPVRSLPGGSRLRSSLGWLRLDPHVPRRIRRLPLTLWLTPQPAGADRGGWRLTSRRSIQRYSPPEERSCTTTPTCRFSGRSNFSPKIRTISPAFSVTSWRCSVACSTAVPIHDPTASLTRPVSRLPVARRIRRASN